ncbi:hypothetical protein ACROYT_G019639 [Oculina patagonica]
MSSTENLLQDTGDKSTNTLESGYHSEGVENDLPRPPKHKEKAGKKKKLHRDKGLENKGFEYDNEQANTSGKRGTVQRASSENIARQLTTKAEQNDSKRRHSFAGQSTVDTTQTVDGVRQKVGKNRRRSSSVEEDLRRRACFNSMRRRFSSSGSSQVPPSEVDTSVEDEVFYENVPVKGPRRNHQGFSYGETSGIKETDRASSMGSLCSAVELENRQLDEYSRRLMSALQERAKLEQELNILRRTASVASMPAVEKWKISPQIHFRNEKYNSERRLSTRGNGDKQFSFEQLKRVQHEQSRKLPDVPRTVRSEDDEFHEELRPVIEKYVERLPQRELSEGFVQNSEEKRKSDKRNEFHEEKRPVIEKNVERLPQRKLSEEFPQQLEEKRKSDSFRLADSEKQRRESKMADLAADLWKKLMKGEKFHGEGEVMNDETAVKTREAATKSENASEVKKSAHSSYAKSGMTGQDSEPRYSAAPGIARLAKGSMPTTSGTEKREKPLVRSESESNLARNDAFRRNQRRPLRYKRASSSTESLTEATKPASHSTFSESKTNKPRQEKPEKLEGVRSTEAVSQNHSKWFDYMLPPGKRGNKKATPSHDTPHASQREIEGTAPSQLSEKLRYYQKLQEQRSQEENSLDLADAFMAAEDAEAEREFQRKAAGEAAILRREASRLLYQAMNLERICDPNARVRHIFTPY